MNLRFSYDTRNLMNTLKEYVQTTGKNMIDVLNRKGRAFSFEMLKLTKKTDREKIVTELGRIVKTSYLSKTGKKRTRKKLEATMNQDGTPLLALIINARRARKGEPGLYGKDMLKAMMKTLGAKLRSVGFARVGWLGDIADLAPFVKGSTQSKEAKQYGQPKGHAIPAKSILAGKASVTLMSNVHGRRTQGLLASIVNRPVQQALNNVEADTRNWLNEHIQNDAARFNHR